MCELDHIYLRVVVKVAVVISHRAGAGGAEPVSASSKIDFPAPLGPITANKLRCGSSKLTSANNTRPSFVTTAKSEAA